MKSNFFCCILLCFLWGCGPANPPHQDFEVFKSGDEYKVRGKEDLVTHFTTNKCHEAIHWALDQLGKEGGSVNILSGRYLLEKTVSMQSATKLKGKGKATQILIGANHETGIGFSVDSSDFVQIADLAIKPENNAGPSAKTGIIVDNSGNAKISNVTVQGMQEYGIHLRNNTFLSEVRGCNIGNSRKSGIFLENLAGQGRAGDFVPNIVSNCKVYGGNVGIECSHAIVANILGCAVYMTDGPGYYLHNTSNSVLISGGRTFQIRDDAVKITNSHEINVTGNIFCWHEGHGIAVNGASWGTITGNNIIDTGHINIMPEEGEEWTYWVDIPEDLDIMANLKTGIHITGPTKGITVNGNAIFNWGSNPPLKYGIFEGCEGVNNTFTANNINYVANAGVESLGQKAVVANNVSQAEPPYEGADHIEKNRLHRFDPGRLEGYLEKNR